MRHETYELETALVGQPGSGKTYLHQYLAQEGLCLFAVDDTLSRLADAVREQQPEIIVVDDAHFDLELVKALKRLRVELGSQFRLHLNCWPGYEQSVQRALDTPEDKVRHLPQLRRQDIFALIQHVGIHGPDWLQHLIIAQSDGKPGLAVALAEVCKTDNVAQVWSGEAAARRLLGDLRLVRSEKERCVLAAFAVGGDAGMAFENVSTALGIPLVELR